MPTRTTRARRLLSRLLDAITQNQASGVYARQVRILSILPVRNIARFPMLAAEKRSPPSKQSCDHEDIETRSLPKSEFKRKN
jgi:hypothetical protein